jgi:hypothetical protein
MDVRTDLAAETKPTRPPSGSPHGRIRRRSAMPEPTLDPKPPGRQSARTTVLDHLKDRLSFLATGCHTIQRLISLTKGQLRTDWDNLTLEQIDELGEWLDGRIKANRAGASIRWTIIRDIFASQRELV